MTDPRYEPLTPEQTWQLLLKIKAPEEALANFRANPQKMTEGINSIRTSPLDIATKRAIIAALDQDDSTS